MLAFVFVRGRDGIVRGCIRDSCKGRDLLRVFAFLLYFPLWRTCFIVQIRVSLFLSNKWNGKKKGQTFSVFPPCVATQHVYTVNKISKKYTFIFSSIIQSTVSVQLFIVICWQSVSWWKFASGNSVLCGRHCNKLFQLYYIICIYLHLQPLLTDFNTYWSPWYRS